MKPFQVVFGHFVAPPAAAVGVAHGGVGLGSAVFGREEVVGDQQVVAVGRFAEHHGFPAVLFVELDDGAVALCVGHHVVVAGADDAVVPDVEGVEHGESFIDGGAAVEPQAHDDAGADAVVSGLLVGRLVGQGHDGGAEAFLVDAVDGSIDGGEAEEFLFE